MYRCSSLKQNSCAALGDGNMVSLANTTCDDGFACKFHDVLDWYTMNNSSILPCKVADKVNIGSNWPCENREASKNLQEGEYPKECLSDGDCELMDGSKNSCVCTPRTSSTAGYCKPNVSSKYFQEYWDLCTLGSNSIYNEYVGYFWYLKIQYAVYYDVVDPPLCKGNLWEFSEFAKVQQQFAGAVGVLALAGLVLA